MSSMHSLSPSLTKELSSSRVPCSHVCSTLQFPFGVGADLCLIIQPINQKECQFRMKVSTVMLVKVPRTYQISNNLLSPRKKHLWGLVTAKVAASFSLLWRQLCQLSEIAKLRLEENSKSDKCAPNPTELQCQLPSKLYYSLSPPLPAARLESTPPHLKE